MIEGEFIMENMLRKKYAELYKEIRYLSVASALSIFLAGCSSNELATNANTSYDMIDTTNSDDLEKGITQVLDVPGEKFKLVINYQCELQEGERWTITSNKHLNMEIKTEGLNDEQVYIDNIHTDTTICSHYAQIDGITQDTMDDRIHNSLLLGFSISDSNSYRGINQINGQNDTFLEGFTRGYNGYVNGEVKEQRFLESNYLENGVYANQISSIIDLIIVKGEETTFVSVPSEIQISVWPYVKIQKKTGMYYQYYYLGSDGKMICEELSEDEYYAQTQTNTRKLTK